MTHPDLPDLLAALNRKERFWLLAKAIGARFAELHPDFRQELGGQVSLDVPAGAWWAFDYHLDWIAVALDLRRQSRTLEREDDLASLDNVVTVGGRTITLMRGSQEDADLIVAFGSTLILVEAKATGSWTRRQMDDKVERLTDLRALADESGVTLHLVLASPRTTNVHRATGADGSSWEEWLLKDGAPRHITLPVGSGERPLVQPKRTDGSGSTYRKVALLKVDRSHWSADE